MIVETKKKSGITYYIDEEKGTVVCKLRGTMFDVEDAMLAHCDCMDFNRFYVMKDCYEGKAHCSPEDKWDKEKGKRIALCRALMSYYNDKDKTFRKIRDDMYVAYNYVVGQSCYAKHKADSYNEELQKHLTE